MRIRDEVRKQLKASIKLYESSIGYGLRKALVAEQNKSVLEFKANELER